MQNPNIKLEATKIENDNPLMFKNYVKFDLSYIPAVIRTAIEMVEDKVVNGDDKKALAIELINDFIQDLEDKKIISQEIFAIAKEMIQHLAGPIIDLVVDASKELVKINTYIKQEANACCAKFKKQKK